MTVLAPVRKFRMTCVDSFQASAYEPHSHQQLDSLVTGVIFGEMRLHVSQLSTVITHCWRHALSDSNDSRFAAPCHHDHDSSCTECTESMLLPEILTKLVITPFHDSVKSQDPIIYRLGRLLEILEESDNQIRSFRHHVIRSVASEHDRREIIDNLEDGHCLIVADYAMKILPTDAIEKQSYWFAKCGISYHMTATTARLNGALYTHSFGHLSAISKQDSTAVAGILHHSLLQLKQNGITHVHIRTDNAGTYHCIGLIATLFSMMDKLGIILVTHIFSEPQFGKGSADRQISISKGKLSSFIDSGKSACTPSEMFEGFVSNILLKGFSFYIVEVSDEESSNAVLKGVKQYSSFRFQKGEGVWVRRHDAIGNGMLVEKEQLPPIKYKISIHRKGGYLSGSEHFWKPVKRGESAEEEMEEQDSGMANATERTDIKLCSDQLCRSRFRTAGALEMHEKSGKHKYYKFTETITDYATEMFSELIETTTAAQITAGQDTIVPLAISDGLEERERGWALRRTERNGALDPNVKNEVEMLIRKDVDSNRRAEAREIKDKLRNLKCPDGSYRFTLKKCLNEGQVKSQITRVLNLKKKEAETQGGRESPASENTANHDQTNTQLLPCTDIVRLLRKRALNKQKRKHEKMAEEMDIDSDAELQDDCVEMMQEEIEKVFEEIFLKS